MALKTDLSAEQRKEIEQILWSYITDWENSVNGYLRIVEDVERIYFGIDGGDGASDDGEEVGIEIDPRPLSKQRLDTLVEQVCTPILRQRPYLLDTSSENLLAEGRGEATHRILVAAKFGARLKAACKIAVNSDLAFLRVVPGGQGTVQISHHHPKDVCVVPALASGLDDAVCVGHKLFKRRGYVQRMRATGKYYDGDDDKLPTAQAEDADGRDVDMRHSGVDPSAGQALRPIDRLVELWDMVVRLSLDELEGGDEWKGEEDRWYRVTYSRTDRQLLALEPYTLSTPWYFELRLQGALKYYPATSVGRDLKPLQLEYTRLWSLHYNAVGTAAAPPVFGPNPEEKFTSYKAYAFIDADAPAGSYFSPAANAHVEQIPTLLEQIRREADAIAGISQNAAGGSVGDQTAREAEIVAAGVSVRLSGYIENFTAQFPRLGETLHEMIAMDYPAFQRRLNLTSVRPPEPSTPPPPPVVDPNTSAESVPEPSALFGPGAPAMPEPAASPLTPLDPVGTGDNGA